MAQGKGRVRHKAASYAAEGKSRAAPVARITCVACIVPRALSRVSPVLRV